MNESHKYDDIIKLPHHISKSHPQMPLSDRAAQFSPFAALTGHDAAIRETARFTEQFVEPDEDQKEQINECLQFVMEHIAKEPEIKVVYFRPDEKKSGGSYVTYCGRVKKVDVYGRRLFFEDKTAVEVDRLVEVKLGNGDMTF